MTKINQKLLDYQNKIASVIDARDDTDSLNVQKARKLMLSVADTLMSANYDLNALKMNVHTINTKDHDVAQVLSGAKSFLDHQTSAVLKTIVALAAIDSKMTNADTNAALDCNFKAKSERDKLISKIVKPLSIATNGAQASQVRNCLMNYGIIKQDGDKQYSLNVKNKNLIKLQELALV